MISSLDSFHDGEVFSFVGKPSFKMGGINYDYLF